MVSTAHSAHALEEAAAAIGQAAAEQRLRLSIVVPVFNNGEFLRTRAFPSLQSLEHFDQVQVLLVDDGSTYRSTVDAVTELAQAFPNVEAILHPTGGSGSASRPRNTALTVAATEYTGFLDPDDEFLGQGPWPLVKALDAADDAQLAIGHQWRRYSDRTETVRNTEHYTHQALGRSRYTAGHRALVHARFRPSNLSSFVLRRSWFVQNPVNQVPGAAGQDSLFFLQVFAAADVFAAVPELIYLYHAETEGSMVNTVGTDYFEKCLIRERAQRQWLEESGLLEDYLRHGLERSLRWYLTRYRRLEGAQQRPARDLLVDMAALYVDPAEHRWRFPELMAFFRRPGVPSVEGMKPVVSGLRRGASTAALKGARAASAGVRAARGFTRSVRTRRDLDR